MIKVASIMPALVASRCTYKCFVSVQLRSIDVFVLRVFYFVRVISFKVSVIIEQTCIFKNKTILKLRCGT